MMANDNNIYKVIITTTTMLLTLTRDWEVVIATITTSILALH